VRKSRLAAELRTMVRGEVRVDEPMAGHTSLRVGGPADLFAAPSDEESLMVALRFAREAGLPCFVLGGGTNLLVSDDGFRGLVVHTAGALGGLRVEEDGRLSAGAGCPLAAAVRRASDEGLSGLEFATGIPGTVGGAVAMNAGAHGGSMEDVLVEVRAAEPGRAASRVPASSLGLAYRRSSVEERGLVVLEAVLALSPDDPDEVRRRCSANVERRRGTQPIEPSAGSVFRNPPSGPAAGELIERAGLKGLRVGGAEVSRVHANFVINRGGATARDVLALVTHVQERVDAMFGIMLEPEIRFLGGDVRPRR